MSRKLLVTSVFACFLKKRAKMPKTRFFLQKFPKFSESVRTHPNASRCIRMHPNASECIRTGPNRSEQVRTFQKTCENLEQFAKFSRTLVSHSCCPGKLSIFGLSLSRPLTVPGKTSQNEQMTNEQANEVTKPPRLRLQSL